MNQPFQGLMKISGAPLRYALAHLGQWPADPGCGGRMRVVATLEDPVQHETRAHDARRAPEVIEHGGRLSLVEEPAEQPAGLCVVPTGTAARRSGRGEAIDSAPSRLLASAPLPLRLVG